jgi:hypothetical protein
MCEETSYLQWCKWPDCKQSVEFKIIDKGCGNERDATKCPKLQSGFKQTKDHKVSEKEYCLDHVNVKKQPRMRENHIPEGSRAASYDLVTEDQTPKEWREWK